MPRKRDLRMCVCVCVCVCVCRECESPAAALRDNELPFFRFMGGPVKSGQAPPYPKI